MTDPQIPTVLGTGLRLVGSIEAEGPVEVHGRLEIDLRCERLDMAHTAEIIGDIAVKHAMIRGRVAGNINAETVRLAETARVEGDIVADDSVEISPGAECAGRLKTMQASEKAKPNASPAKASRNTGA
ncbi:MAG: polymer-forming cytoskeletal protein [Hyphomicrobiales bacterium]|nr:polymer-forming cytoskeletal protein [Hyphomicrobiales bacterium]